MANPTFVGMEVADSGGVTQTTLTCNIHASALADDLAVLICGNDENSNTAQFDDVNNKPTGSTLVATDGNANSDSHYGIFTKVLTSSDISTGSITFNAANSNEIYGWVRVYRDFNASNIVNVIGTSTRVSGSSVDIAAVTTTVDDCTVLAVTVFDGGDTNFAWSGTDWSELSELHSGTSATDACGTIGHNEMTGQGTSNTATVTFDITDGHAAVQFAIEPGTDGGSAGAGVAPTGNINGPLVGVLGGVI